MIVTQCDLYRAFGLILRSDIELPELTKITNNNNTLDVSIEYRDLKGYWEEIANNNRICLVKGNSVWLYIEGIAIFKIVDGKSIFVNPLDENREDQIRLYILGSCMCALLLQRQVLPIHGSAVVIRNKAYAIMGESGAGKSTLAKALLSKGYTLLSDDIIPVSMINGIPMVTPAYPQQKLWKESLDAFNVNTNQFSSIFDRETKFIVPVPSQFQSEPMPLSGIFELVKGEEKEVKIRPINKLEQVRKLYDHTFRQFLVNRLNLTEWHFHLTTAIANVTSMHQLIRPNNGFTTEEQSSKLINTI